MKAIVEMNNEFFTAHITRVSDTGVYAEGARFDKAQTTKILDHVIKINTQFDYFTIDNSFCMFTMGSFGASCPTVISPDDQGLYSFNPGWTFRFVSYKLDRKALIQFRCVNLFCKWNREWMQLTTLPVDRREPDHYQELDRRQKQMGHLRTIAWRNGVRELDRIYHYREALKRGDEVYYSSSKSYKTADYFGPPLALAMQKQNQK